MSTKGEVLRHPINGSPEQTWDGFSWPGFGFGVIWLLVKGLYGHFLINLVLIVVTAGFASPIIWIVYGFIGNGAHKSSLLKKGYLTKEQWSKKENPQSTAPRTPLLNSRDQMTQLKDLVELKEKGFITQAEFTLQKSKILGT